MNMYVFASSEKNEITGQYYIFFIHLDRLVQGAGIFHLENVLSGVPDRIVGVSNLSATACTLL